MKMKVGTAEIDISSWEPVGSTRNCDHFLAEPKLMISVYKEGSKDNEGDAREQLRFQEEFIESRGGGFDLIVLIDNLVSQDAASRRVYAQEPTPSNFRGTALVGGSFLSRGVASFFLGISSTAVPMKFFASIDDARAWLDGLDAPGGG
jgi:hypothetical protein